MGDERVDAKLIKALAQRSERPFADPLWEEWAAGEPYRRFLHWLCRELGGPSLELGVDGGHTSALMAAAGHLTVGVDHRPLNPTAPPFRFPNFRFLWCDTNFRFLWCDTLGAASVVGGVLAGRKLSVVFQDSSHHAEPSRLEWEYYRPMMAPGAVWVCDDVTPAFQMRDEPRSLVDYFEALPGTKLTFPDLHKGNVIGVVLA